MNLSAVERGLLAALNTDPAPSAIEAAERMGLSKSRMRDLIRNARIDGWVRPSGYHLTGKDPSDESGPLALDIVNLIRERDKQGKVTGRRHLLDKLGLTQAVANYTLSKMRQDGSMSAAGAVVLTNKGRELVAKEGGEIADVDTVLDTVVSWPGSAVTEIADEVGCTPAAARAAIDVLRGRRMISSPRFDVSGLPPLDWPHLSPAALYIGMRIARANRNGSSPTVRSLSHRCEFKSERIKSAVAELRSCGVVVQDRPHATARGESFARNRLSQAPTSS